VARQHLLVALLLIMILDDIPSFGLVFLLSFFAKNYLVIYLSDDLMMLFILGKLFAYHFILAFKTLYYYFDWLMLLICCEIH